MKTYARIKIGLTPELKNYLSEEDLYYEASEIVREAVQRALASLDGLNLPDIPQSEAEPTEAFLIRADFDTLVLVRSFRRPDRKKFYALVNKIALSLVKEKLELRRKIKEKVAQLGKPKTEQTKESDDIAQRGADAAPETTDAASETTDAASHRHQHREVIDAAPEY